MNTQGSGQTRPIGDLIAHVERNLGALEARPMARVSYAYKIKNWLSYRHQEVPMQVAYRLLGCVKGFLPIRSRMNAMLYRPDLSKLAPWEILKLQDLLRCNTPLVTLPALFGGMVLDYGLLSRLNVTDTGVQFIVDAFANSVEMENMKYHGLGTGASAAAQTDTALGTEITASHYAGSVRPTGSTIEGGTANVYRTVGTHTQTTAGDTVTEHGIFSATSAGVMIDRHVFTGVALAVADSFQTTYDLTFSANG